MENVTKIAQDLNLKESQIAKVLDLTSQGNTIPFIARYRKEMTGNLDEVQIKAIIDLDKSMTALTDRKATVLAKIEEQGKLTAELKKAIENAEKLADVEELYLPYKEKRRTKATIAREAGLFPLARLILQNKPSLEVEAANFITEGFETADKTLAGACEILIEAFQRTTSSAHGFTMKSGLTAQSYQQLKTKLPMIIKPSKFTTIFQRKFLKFKVIVFWRLIVVKNSAF